MNTYIAQKQIDQAIAAANAQIAKSPANSGFYDLLGSVLFHVKKDLNGAEAAFKRSVELDKNNFGAVIQLGQVQAAKGEIDQAIATYQQAIKDHPRRPNSIPSWAGCMDPNGIGPKLRTRIRKHWDSSRMTRSLPTTLPTCCWKVAAISMRRCRWPRQRAGACLTRRMRLTP